VEFVKEFEKIQPLHLSSPEITIAFNNIAKDDPVREEIYRKAKMSNFKPLKKWITNEKGAFEDFVATVGHKYEYENLKSTLYNEKQTLNKKLMKLKAGQLSFSAIFAKNGRAQVIEELENELEVVNNDHNMVERMIELLLAVVKSEIENFKNDWIYPYLMILRKAARKELDVNEKIEDNSGEKTRGDSFSTAAVTQVGF